jgi:molybdate transport system substrate-binding protein
MVSALLCVLLPTAHALAGEITLSIAASLKDVMNDLTESYAGKHPGTKFFKNYGASGMLARQIESGAPSDIFISANPAWMDYLKSKGFVDPVSVGTFACNSLVFAGIPGKASRLQDLPRLDRIAIGSPRSVPAGEYAMEALKKAGVDGQLDGKLMMAKDVRECLMYAERGEVDGAFVYRTDALRAKHARILFTVPQELYPRVVYPMSLTASGAKNRDAAAFFSFLHGNEARTVLAKYGFTAR